MADHFGLSVLISSGAAGLGLPSSVGMIGGGSAPLVSFLWLLPSLPVGFWSFLFICVFGQIANRAIYSHFSARPEGSGSGARFTFFGGAAPGTMRGRCHFSLIVTTSFSVKYI